MCIFLNVQVWEMGEVRQTFSVLPLNLLRILNRGTWGMMSCSFSSLYSGAVGRSRVRNRKVDSDICSWYSSVTSKASFSSGVCKFTEILLVTLHHHSKFNVTVCWKRFHTLVYWRPEITMSSALCLTIPQNYLTPFTHSTLMNDPLASALFLPTDRPQKSRI